MVFDNTLDRTRHAVPPQHLQNHVLGTDPVRQSTREAHTEDAGHLQGKGMAGHGHRNLQAARPHCEHAQCSSRRSVTVRAQQGLPGGSKSLLVYRVADSVARSAEPEPVFSCRAQQKAVVIRVFVVFLEEVVVHVLNRTLGLDTCHAHGFEFEHDQRAGCVLGEGLIDLQRDLFSGLLPAFDEVRRNELLRYVHDVLTCGSGGC